MSPGLVQQILSACTAATRCRLATKEDECDAETARALERAAQRYSRHVAELADQLAAEARS
jgi:hypothetical protein